MDEQQRYNEVIKPAFDDLKNDITTLMSIMQRVDVAIRGNGKEGLNVRVSRLEDARKERKWLLRAIAGAVIVGAATYIRQQVCGG